MPKTKAFLFLCLKSQKGTPLFSTIFIRQLVFLAHGLSIRKAFNETFARIAFLLGCIFQI